MLVGRRGAADRELHAVRLDAPLKLDLKLLFDSTLVEAAQGCFRSTARVKVIVHGLGELDASEGLGPKFGDHGHDVQSGELGGIEGYEALP